MLALGAKHMKRLNELSRKENTEAMASLQKQGLALSEKPTAEQLKQYDSLGKTARGELVGKLYPKTLLDGVEKSLDSLRSGKTKKS